MLDLVMDVIEQMVFVFGSFVLIFICFINGHGMIKLDVKCNQLIYNAPGFTDIVDLDIKEVQNYIPSHPTYSDYHLYMDPCQQESKMKIIWEHPKDTPSGNHVILCLLHILADGMLTEEKACYNFTLQRTEKKTEVHCSVTTPSYKDILLMKTYVTIHDIAGSTNTMYTEATSLNRDTLCQTEYEPSVNRIHGCNTNGRFKVVETDSVMAVIAKDSQNNTRYLTFKSMDGGYTEFTLDSSMNGSYTLQIVIHRHDIYTTIEKNIHVICHVNKMPAPSTKPEQSGGFVTFLAVMSLGVVLIVTIIFTVIWICSRYKQNHRMQQRASFEHRRSSDRYPLNNVAETRQFLRDTNGVDVRNGRNSARISRAESENIDSKASTDRHIMILPMSYDHYVRDLVLCLKELFSFQGKATCKCVFDSSTLADFKRDKYNWISSVLHDSAAIVIVLCFASPHDQNRESTCVDEILEQCKQHRIKPQCQLYFLNMTGRDYGPSLHHGETIVVKERVHIDLLLKKLFKLCGFNSDQEEHLLHDEHFTQSINKLLFHE